ncbi:Ubiquitin carboxyl-terminal hydrolase 19 [Nymphon striatum]|nr:Ubiquitin carboxyl-terminal hydrolase 19 [Nymphon striatum]KAG1650460.1 Ubiquitin carboxyl-terminal hydrolase 19 [Nymphon striatum]
MMLKKVKSEKWGQLKESVISEGVAIPQNKWVSASSSSSAFIEKMAPSNKSSQTSEKSCSSTIKPIPITKPTCMVLPLKSAKSVEQLVSPGMTGLNNVGNTCFMNSVIQCLANTRELRDYFLNGDFQSDINVDNTLGTGGKLAVSFAGLLKVLWSASYHSYSPAKLKNLISQKASQFTGYAQHDAQEFMAFLLDGLHEVAMTDLNRVKEKPYIENVDSDDQDDEFLANESWDRYKMRNDSVIVDLFQGQYKSKLVCPVCDKISITFDPFLYLSVPLPKKQLNVEVLFFWRDLYKKPIKLGILEVSRGRIIKCYREGTLISSASTYGELFAFEKFDEVLAGEPIVELAVIQRILHPSLSNRCSFCKQESPPDSTEKLKRCTNCLRVCYCDQICQKNHWATHKTNCKACPEVIGQPFLLTIPKSQATISRIYELMESFSSILTQVALSISDEMSTSSQSDSAVSSNVTTLSTTTSNLSNSARCDNQENSEITDNKFADTEISNRSRLELFDNKEKLDCSEPEKCDKNSTEEMYSTRLVCAVTQNNQLENTSKPFFIKPLNSHASSSLLHQNEHLANEPLNLVSISSFAMDWKNNPSANVITIKTIMATPRRQRITAIEAQRLIIDGLEDDSDLDDDSSESSAQECDVSYQNHADESSDDNFDDMPDGDVPTADISQPLSLIFLILGHVSHVIILLKTSKSTLNQDNFTLENCLQLFSEPEILSPEEAWYCSKCKNHREASKEMTLWRLPTVLLIQLKRFSFKSHLWRDKLDKMVHFPTRLV